MEIEILTQDPCMTIVRLTQKLQKEMGLKSSDLKAIPNSSTPFEEWYAHLLFMDRRKYIIFVETQTLFSFALENVSRKDIRCRLFEIFEKGYRRTIGAMNELVKHHKYSFYEQDRDVDVQDCYNRRMPMRGFPNGSKEYKLPMDVFTETLKQEWNINFKPQEFNFFKESFTIDQETMF